MKRRIMLLALFLAPVVFSIIFTNDASALDSYKHIGIDSEGVHFYGEEGDQDYTGSFEWKPEEKILELNYYVGGRIFIEDFDAEVILKGDNFIYSDDCGIGSYKSLTVSGDGSLSTDADYAIIINSSGLAMEETLNIKSGTINGPMWTYVFVMDGGEWNIPVTEDSTMMPTFVFVLNKGTINSKQPIWAMATFTQNGGELNIDIPPCEDGDQECMNGRGMIALSAGMAVFNNGKTTLKGGSMGALSIQANEDYMADEEARTIILSLTERVGGSIPGDGKLVEFNGSHVVAESNGSLGALFVMAENPERMTDESLFIADNFEVIPKEAKYTIVEGNGLRFGVFNDGEGESEADSGGMAITHVANRIEIVQKDEEKEEDKDGGNEEDKDNPAPTNDDEKKNDKSDKNNNINNNTDKNDGSNNETYDVPNTGYFDVNHSELSIDSIIVFVLALVGVVSCYTIRKFIIKNG